MLLGLDIGTSVIKAALFESEGRECAEAAERMQLLPAPIGWSELDGEAVWQAATKVIPVRTRRLRTLPTVRSTRPDSSATFCSAMIMARPSCGRANSA